MFQEYPDICQYAPGRRGEVRTAILVLPGSIELAEVTYEIMDGLAILDGGIILGPVDEVEREARMIQQEIAGGYQANDIPEASTVGSISQPLLAVRQRQKLWDGGIVPYQFDGLNALLREHIEQAMEFYRNNTNIEFVPASDSFPNRVIFKFSQDPTTSSAEIGRTGRREQFIYLNEFFDVGGIVHEIGHTLGLLHEHTRNDRDNFVRINSDNILDGREHNFSKNVRGSVDLGPYDYSSIMHYSARALGKEDPNNPGVKLVTIEPLDSSVTLERLNSARRTPPYLTNTDITHLRQLYPLRTEFDGGHLWGEEYYATCVAFGDIDGDGFDELVVTRYAGDDYSRYFIFDDARHDFRLLFEGGQGWGDGYYATCCALGDVDGDGRDEIIIGRKADENLRFEILKYRSLNDVSQIFAGGEGWGEGYYTTSVAIGIDSSGTPLIGVARRATSSGRVRFFVYTGQVQGFELLFEGGQEWGDGYYATGIAFGDVDGDGRLEVGVARYGDDEDPRFFIYNSPDQEFRLMHSGGSDWGSGYYATGITFGDVDGDGRDEMGVTRKASENERFFVFDDFDQQFRLLHSGGRQWGSGYYATSIAMGDVDGDGRAEVAVTRYADENSRYFIFDDENENYRTLTDGGYGWGSGYYARSIALGNASRIEPRQRHVAVARKAHENARFIVQEINL